MPNKVVKMGGLFRLVEARTGRIVKNRAGTAVDGGGNRSKTRVEGQRTAIRLSKSKR